MKHLILSLLTLLSLTAAAERIGTWTLFPSYYGITQVAPAGTDIFVLASGNLYSFHPADNSLTTYYKDDPLSDLDGGCLSSNDIRQIAWCGDAGRLIVAYGNQKIDLLTVDKDVTTFTDLADKQMAGDKNIYNICVYGQRAYICTGFGIINFDVRNEHVIDTYNLGQKVSDTHVTSTHIYALTDDGVVKAPLSGNLLDPNSWSTTGELWTDLKPSQDLSNDYGTLFRDSRNSCYWGNDPEGRLARYEHDEDGTLQQKGGGVVPDGPQSENFWRLYLHDGRLFATCGNLSYGFSGKIPGCVQIYDGSSWDVLASPGRMTGYDYIDANCMAFDPLDKNHFWVGAASGLYEYSGYKPVKAHIPANSALTGMYNYEEGRSNVCSMAYDRDNTLWVMNGWCDTPLVQFSRDGSSRNFPQRAISFENRYNVDAQSAFISPANGYLWWNNNQWDKTAVFRYDWRNNTLLPFTSFMNQDGATISHHQIFDLTEDKDGNIWVASDGGPFYLSRSAARTETADNVAFVQHKVPRNDGTNYADYLLDGIPVRTIAIDAANRKWIGTATTGIYLISSDNNTELHHFTTENSPIPSDFIYDIVIDSETGIVYIATEKGLCTYQGDISDANAEEMSKETAWAYPNPVTPEYTGMITVTGLTPGAQVKILTSSGQLVNEGICQGGSYLWDGCDTRGRKVASGVYMVSVATPEGEKGIVTKIAIVR